MGCCSFKLEETGEVKLGTKPDSLAEVEELDEFDDISLNSKDTQTLYESERTTVPEGICSSKYSLTRSEIEIAFLHTDSATYRSSLVELNFNNYKFG